MLAEQVLRVQQAIEADAYAARALDDELIRELHRGFCASIVPDWAGRWRSISVRVGPHEPPAPHLVALEMHGYVRDLAARLSASEVLDLLPETLAFAEGRLLSIHPFNDFNGRLTRLWLWELLRRLSLPPVELAFTEPSSAQRYLTALRAGDQRDWEPLTIIWRERLARSSGV